jgi:hypothetical protein
LLRSLYKIASAVIFFFALLQFSSCKKDKLITDSSAKVRFSQDSVLFDTVFTSIGSATKNIRVRNNNSQKIKISNIQLLGGGASNFIINVDGSRGRTFSDIEIAAHDSMYIFIQVNVNPNNAASPLIINDGIQFTVNGNLQTVYLEAWGQDAWYHRPTTAIKFKDGSYLPYSLISSTKGADTTWIKDKPHVIYGYLVVDTAQKLTINAGVQIYLNNKGGLWVYQGGQIKILGQKDNEVTFQGARREKDYADEPGQWDRIWINEGSDNNIIDYAIIKNGYIGLQTEVIGNTIGGKGRLRITNTKIQNMSLWGLYSLAYHVYGGNNVISNCQEYSLNIQLGGRYTFVHCTFANYWNKSKARDKPAININNYTDTQILPLDTCYFGNCIIDGKLSNEINLDLKNTVPATTVAFSNCWLKTNIDVSAEPGKYINVRTPNLNGGADIDYVDKDHYLFQTTPAETRVKGFQHPNATADALKFPLDIKLMPRNSFSVTAGAYEVN